MLFRSICCCCFVLFVLVTSNNNTERDVRRKQKYRFPDGQVLEPKGTVIVQCAVADVEFWLPSSVPFCPPPRFTADTRAPHPPLSSFFVTTVKTINNLNNSLLVLSCRLFLCPLPEAVRRTSLRGRCVWCGTEPHRTGTSRKTKLTRSWMSHITVVARRLASCWRSALAASAGDHQTKQKPRLQ